MAEMYLVLIETSGNQNYIFSTNRLRENMGASELTYQAGTYWIGDAVDNQNQQKQFQNCFTPKQFRAVLKKQFVLEESEQQAEIIVAASGKALIVVKDKDTARKIISEVTRRALIEAPGLDISGVYESFMWSEKDSASLSKAIKEIHKIFEKERSHRRSPENRFLRLPIIASCAVSGLPASQTITTGTKKQSVSEVSFTKHNKAREAKERLTDLEDRKLPSQIDQLLRDEESEEEKRAWLAVVHADGNGLGQIFINFERYIGEDKNNRDYINKYRLFSLALDECTEAAFKEALDVFPEEADRKNKKVAPIVPLVIGGDDLTVVCDGHYALEFTRVFLQEFEEQTGRKPEISEIARKAFGVGRLSACAGIAIVKRHFPFSVAYSLAEDLIKSAKEVKRKVICRVTDAIPPNTPFPCSAIDFHILYDTRGINLGGFRSQLQPERNTYLYSRPYVVSSDLNQAEGQEWALSHQWGELSSRIEQLNSGVLPSSQIHALRTALFLGKAEADSQLQLIQHRYENLSQFIETRDPASLFHLTPDKNYITSFLDALDAMDFLKNSQTEPSQAKEETACP